MLPQALTYSRRRIAQMKVLFGESHSGSELVLKAKYMPRVSGYGSIRARAVRQRQDRHLTLPAIPGAPRPAAAGRVWVALPVC